MKHVTDVFDRFARVALRAVQQMVQGVVREFRIARARPGMLRRVQADRWFTALDQESFLRPTERADWLRTSGSLSSSGRR